MIVKLKWGMEYKGVHGAVFDACICVCSYVGRCGEMCQGVGRCAKVWGGVRGDFYIHVVLCLELCTSQTCRNLLHALRQRIHPSNFHAKPSVHSYITYMQDFWYLWMRI